MYDVSSRVERMDVCPVSAVETGLTLWREGHSFGHPVRLIGTRPQGWDGVFAVERAGPAEEGGGDEPAWFDRAGREDCGARTLFAIGRSESKDPDEVAVWVEWAGRSGRVSLRWPRARIVVGSGVERGAGAAMAGGNGTTDDCAGPSRATRQFEWLDLLADRSAVAAALAGWTRRPLPPETLDDPPTWAEFLGQTYPGPASYRIPQQRDGLVQGTIARMATYGARIVTCAHQTSTTLYTWLADAVLLAPMLEVDDLPAGGWWFFDTSESCALCVDGFDAEAMVVPGPSQIDEDNRALLERVASTNPHLSGQVDWESARAERPGVSLGRHADWLTQRVPLPFNDFPARLDEEEGELEREFALEGEPSGVEELDVDSLPDWLQWSPVTRISHRADDSFLIRGSVRPSPLAARSGSRSGPVGGGSAPSPAHLDRFERCPCGSERSFEECCGRS